MIKNYKKIKEVNKKANQPDHIYSKLFSHPLSYLLIAIIEDTKITPNLLTLISTLFAILGSCFIITLTSHLGLILAWVILHLALIFDSADGQLARYKKKSSVIGGYFDVFSDYIFYKMVIIAITIRFSYYNEHAFFIGLVIMAVYSLAVMQNHLIVNTIYKNKNIGSKKTKMSEKVFGQSKIKKILVQIQDGLTGGGSYMYIAIAFIFNMPELYLYIIGFLSIMLIIKRTYIFYLTVKGM